MRLLRMPLLVRAILIAAGFTFSASAQWITQSFNLAPGWNAVYFHVDARHALLDQMVGEDAANPIQEIWLWQPSPATAQFVTSPQTPTIGGSQWVSWDRSSASGSPLQSIPGNAACLVRVGGTANYLWQVKGKVVPPDYLWTSTGLNFIGFPTPENSATTFERFLSPAPAFYQAAQVFAYSGGDLGANNPAQVFALRTKPVTRGQAFWIRSGNTYNSYFGPFELSLDDSAGVRFGSELGQGRLRLRNLTAAALTLTVRLLNSEAPPTGQTPIKQLPPLLMRGALNTTNLTYSYSNLVTTAQTVVLAPSGQIGSQAEVVVGLNRFQMTGQVGDLFVGILRLTDSTGLSQVDVPVTAEVASLAGLWVGEAAVTSVNQYLKSYATNEDGTLQTTVDGAYVSNQTNSNPGAVPKPFPLRLIIHNDGTNSYLLQRAFHGLDSNSNLVVATQERFLNAALLNSARRISSVHLPWSAANNGWLFDVPLGAASSMTVTVPLSYADQSSNPFLHTYHPDHSGMDATGRNPLARGQHAYDITRVMTLTIAAPDDDFASLTGNSGVVRGNYTENVTLRGIDDNARQFQSSGQFSLNRISSVATLVR
jgi:hypothetical protein